MAQKKYSDLFMDWLREAGYTHCFYVPGGNSMHLLESASHRFKCVSFLHEISACIATDYFNEISDKNYKAFLLVTAGPGLTNAMTGIVGAWTESRELLIIGGQAKSTELSKGRLRQIGFQEIDGVTICKSVSKKALRGDKQISKSQLFDLINLSKTPRKGPVFIELCIDISFQNREEKLDDSVKYLPTQLTKPRSFKKASSTIANLLLESERPLFLLGGGIDRSTNLQFIFDLGIPVATTFNGSDRANSNYEYYCGRPNWYGSRWSNLIIQQADLIIALGTRLGINQTGYNHSEFAPVAKVIQIEIDKKEKLKNFPQVEKFFPLDCNGLLVQLSIDLDRNIKSKYKECKRYIVKVREELNYPEIQKDRKSKYLNSNKFIFDLMKITKGNEIIIPCSSGIAAYESAMRIISNKGEQLMVTSHSLASMGYGLAGGIGASLAYPERKTIVFEGDGGFAQNLQELGTVAYNNLNVKIFIFDNGGYQSIKLNQTSSFDGEFIGCNRDTGILLPNWIEICKSFGLKYLELDSKSAFSKEFYKLYNSTFPAIFIVKIDPNQNYWPRIVSKRISVNEVVSEPLHRMYPPLDSKQIKKYLPYLNNEV
jgi:acetolactate synthase-1/2/3 large subunit